MSVSDASASPNFTNMHVRGSVLLQGRCNMSCTSGFVDDVKFSCNEIYGGGTLAQHRRCSVVHGLTTLICCVVFVASGPGRRRAGRQDQTSPLCKGYRTEYAMHHNIKTRRHSESAYIRQVNFTVARQAVIVYFDAERHDNGVIRGRACCGNGHFACVKCYIFVHFSSTPTSILNLTISSES